MVFVATHGYLLTSLDQITDASAENPPAYDENNWDDSLDGEGDADITWELERQHEHETASNESSVTLSSKTSTKRTIDEVELEELAGLSPPSSPGKSMVYLMMSCNSSSDNRT